MVARGQVSLHAPPLLGRKSSAAKSNHSHTCAAALQAKSLLSLTRYPGGGGRLLHDPLATRPAPLVYPEQDPRAAISFVSPAYEILTRNSIISPPYAKTGEYTPPPKMSARRHFWFFPIFFAVFAGPGGWRIQFAITSWVATSLARVKKLRYAGSVASGGFPPHSLSVVPLAIQFPVNEG
jgi:hypothetical protein